MQTTEQRIIEIVKRHLGIDDQDVNPSDSLVDDLGADSLDEIEMLMEVEEEFEIEIADDLAESIKTIADAVSVVDGIKLVN